MASQPATGKLLDGVFVNKPQGISSAQVLRNLQEHFNPSKLFAATIAAEADRLQEASRHSNQWRRKKAQQRRLRQVKIGHGGTLDPLATGVLITGIGNGTKSLQNFLGCTKSYEATVLFGAATDTYDILGKVVRQRAFEHITKQKVLDKLAEFREIKVQRPPIYSALRHEGKRFYEYARDGKELPIDIPERSVEITELEMVEWYEPGEHSWEWPKQEVEKDSKDDQADTTAQAGAETTTDSDLSATVDLKRGREEGEDEAETHEPASKKHQADDQHKAAELEGSEEPLMSGALPAGALPAGTASQAEESSSADKRPPACRIRMTVSSGFYVRSLCHDLGEALDSAALMATLVRTRQQSFELGKNVFEYSELDKGEEAWGPRVEKLLEEWRTKSGSEMEASSPPRYEEAAKASNGSRAQKRRAASPDEKTVRERRRNSSSDGS